MPVWQFAAAIFVARIVRYGGEGLLAVYYGDHAGDFLKAHTKEAGLALAGFALLGGVAWILWQRRRASA